MKHYIYPFLGALTLFTACGDENVVKAEDPTYEQILNTPLVAALEAQGFEFTEDGELVVNQKVLDTETLDLSDSKLKSLFGLSAFKNLKTVDLSGNLFMGIVDFSPLPLSIKSLNLSKNPTLEEYFNLERLTLDNLMLPSQAHWNMKELIDYAQTESAAETKIQFDMGEKVVDFTFERPIADAQLAAQLKSLYPSVMSADGRSIDLRQEMTEEVDLVLTDTYNDLSGIEYFIAHPDYEGATGRIVITGNMESPCVLTYIAPNEGVKSLTLKGVSTPESIDFTQAARLTQLTVIGNDDISSLELPEHFWGNSVAQTEFFNHGITLKDCPKLESFTLPEQPAMIGKVALINLPLLKTVNLEPLSAFHTLALVGLDVAQITMPHSLVNYVDGFGGGDDQRKVVVAFDETIQANNAVRSFIEAQKQVAQVIDFSNYYTY